MCIDLIDKLCKLMQTEEQVDQLNVCQCAGANYLFRNILT
jgi:hypothetical protein